LIDQRFLDPVNSSKGIDSHITPDTSGMSTVLPFTFPLAETESS
jgi:hypothetical protein